MTSEFTKYEAVEFLGQVVRIKQRWEVLREDNSEELLRGIPLDYLDEGALCRVDLIEDNNGHISLILAGFHDDDLRSFDKSDFEQYCQVLKSELPHARTV